MAQPRCCKLWEDICIAFEVHSFTCQNHVAREPVLIVAWGQAGACMTSFGGGLRGSVLIEGRILQLVVIGTVFAIVKWSALFKLAIHDLGGCSRR